MRNVFIVVVFIFLLLLISISIYFLFLKDGIQNNTSTINPSNVVNEPTVTNNQLGFIYPLAKNQYLLAAQLESYESKNNDVMGTFKVSGNKKQKFLLFKKGYFLNIDYLSTNNIKSVLDENRNQITLENEKDVKSFLEKSKGKDFGLIIYTDADYKIDNALKEYFTCNKSMINESKLNLNNVKCTPFTFEIRHYENN